jgi:hypothetical protein
MNLLIDNAQLSLRKEALGYPYRHLALYRFEFSHLDKTGGSAWPSLPRVNASSENSPSKSSCRRYDRSLVRIFPARTISTSKLPSLADDYTYAHDSWAIGLHQPGDTVDASPAIRLWETEQVGRIDILSLEIEHRYRTWAEWFADPLLVQGTDTRPRPLPPTTKTSPRRTIRHRCHFTGSILQWAAANDKMVAIAVPPWIDGVQDDLDPGSNYLALVNGDYDEYHQGMIQRLTDFNTRIVVFRLMWLIDTGKPWSYDMLDPDKYTSIIRGISITIVLF